MKYKSYINVNGYIYESVIKNEEEKKIKRWKWKSQFFGFKESKI